MKGITPELHSRLVRWLRSIGTSNAVYFSDQLLAAPDVPEPVKGKVAREKIKKIEAELDEVAAEMRAFAGDFQDESEEQVTVQNWADILDHPQSRVRALLQDTAKESGS